MTDQPPPAGDLGELSPDALGSALRDIVEFVDDAGWGQPPTLFALVPTATLAATQPELVDADDDSELSPVVQDTVEVAGPGPETGAAIERLLATTAWPPMVVGAALVQEILVLPPEAESDLDTAFDTLLGTPDDPGAADAAARATARSHPGRRSARLVVGALRGGQSLSLMQLRPAPGEEPATDPSGRVELLTHADLAPELRAAVAQTLTADPDS
ncbi:PPA1309 family protein [Gordonia sp. OPL2]|uniref:PPA1309 family protein n=1 Tax=Gordonia sp. OPL2 TaxID=2486274 RepID=UPI0016555339|nr:PPA1309 family protein [Gordonia sp. OPL2]ROZ99259.1 hypothetical protein EEB19_12720 [Gordonia sp. OPL2]